MRTFINSCLQIGSLSLPHRLIQGPLAGYSCAPFRVLFSHYKSPAYSVTEMSSARDILYKHRRNSRYLYRSPLEQRLAYQLSGTEPEVLAEAAWLLQGYGADLIDINCGCPKSKIRKKGAGSALLDLPEQLISILKAVRLAVSIPLTIKIRIQRNQNDLILAQKIEEAGADALIVHGRRWMDDYDVACDFQQIAQIKQRLSIPVIANGDIHDSASLQRAIEISACDAYMIARAGSGRPWLYQELLEGTSIAVSLPQRTALFMQHLQDLALLEGEYKALMQSRSLIRYYFTEFFDAPNLAVFYLLDSLEAIKNFFYSSFLPGYSDP